MFFYIQKEIIMAGTSTEGVGQGSVINIYPRILNDVVKTENLKEAGSILENLLSDITISTANGTATNMDANSITFRSGSGYAFDPAFTGGVTVGYDGGDINLYAGQATGDGNAGNINIEAGDAGRIRLLSMPVMPVYANNTARDAAAAGTATEGMFCYNTDTNNVEFYINGAWKSFNLPE
jgi:hypothetical protein